jgi:hypothetical protein
MTETLDFTDYTPWEQLVGYAGTKYMLREATGEAARLYRTASLRGVELDRDEDANKTTTRRLEAITGVEPLLVSLCLFSENPAKPGTFDVPVSESTVGSFPSKVQKAWFDKIKDVSDLDEGKDPASLKKQRERLTALINKIEAQNNPK